MSSNDDSTAQVSLPSDTEVRVARDFKATARLVWRAHTEPEMLRRWIGGYPGWTMQVCEMDVRIGGKYRWYWRSDDGTEFGFHGDFREVDEPNQIVHAEYFDPGTMGGPMNSDAPAIIRTTFTESHGITKVVVLMNYASKEARDGAVSTGMTDGMEVSYKRLDEVVSKEQAG